MYLGSNLNNEAIREVEITANRANLFVNVESIDSGKHLAKAKSY